MTNKFRVPAVTLLLIVANIAVAFLLLVDPRLVAEYGFQPRRPSLFTAFTSFFLHANVIHLLGNMVFLAAVGAAVELATGSGRFLLVYFVSGLVGVAAHYALTSQTPDPPTLIGASGAIAGCAGYYSVRYKGLRVALAPNFAISVAVVTYIWIGLQLAGALIRIGDSGQGGVAFWSHLGGFAAGVVLSFVFRSPDLRQIALGHEVLERMNQRGPAAVLLAAREHLRTHPDDPRGWEEVAHAQASLGNSQEEAEAWRRLVDIGDSEQSAHALATLLNMKAAGTLPAHRRAMLADQFKKSRPDIAQGLLNTLIDAEHSEPERPEALLALAALLRESDLKTSRRWLSRLASEYPLHPATELARSRGWIT